MFLKGLDLLPPLEPSHVKEALASHQGVVFIWMQLPEAFPGAGPRPSKGLNVARLES